jgi:hypothetical protein
LPIYLDAAPGRKPLPLEDPAEGVAAGVMKSFRHWFIRTAFIRPIADCEGIGNRATLRYSRNLAASL